MDVKLDKVREFAASEKAYRPPKEVKSGDSSDIQDLDEIKLHELKEVSWVSASSPSQQSSKAFFSVLQFVRSQ